MVINDTALQQSGLKCLPCSASGRQEEQQEVLHQKARKLLPAKYYLLTAPDSGTETHIIDFLGRSVKILTDYNEIV